MKLNSKDYVVSCNGYGYYLCTKNTRVPVGNNLGIKYYSDLKLAKKALLELVGKS